MAAIRCKQRGFQTNQKEKRSQSGLQQYRTFLLTYSMEESAPVQTGAAIWQRQGGCFGNRWVIGARNPDSPHPTGIAQPPAAVHQPMRTEKLFFHFNGSGVIRQLERCCPSSGWPRRTSRCQSNVSHCDRDASSNEDASNLRSTIG